MLLQVAGGTIKLELVHDSWTELQGEIAGPPDTPYEGGTFVLEIKVPETYPFNPPKVNLLFMLRLLGLLCNQDSIDACHTTLQHLIRR